MGSPFPGMDPYLEGWWGDVHHGFITYVTDSLQPVLPHGLRARIRARRCVEPGCPGIIEPIRRGSVVILDVSEDHRLVSAIELLTPEIKQPGVERDRFLDERSRWNREGISIVEIDLLRGGQRVTAAPPDSLPPDWRTAYQVCIWRASRDDAVEVYRAPLRERLPVIPIPLRPADPDVPLDLQALIDRCYRNGGYDDIDYRTEADPPLDPDDAAWADGLLREQGRR